ncbi:unnamed protein product [Victoria cruziana]
MASGKGTGEDQAMTQRLQQLPYHSSGILSIASSCRILANWWRIQCCSFGELSSMEEELSNGVHGGLPGAHNPFSQRALPRPPFNHPHLRSKTPNLPSVIPLSRRGFLANPTTNTRCQMIRSTGSICKNKPHDPSHGCRFRQKPPTCLMIPLLPRHVSGGL